MLLLLIPNISESSHTQHKRLHEYILHFKYSKSWSQPPTLILFPNPLVSKFWLICSFFLFMLFKTSISRSNRMSRLSNFISEASSIISSRSRSSSCSISCVGNICQDEMQTGALTVENRVVLAWEGWM